MDMRQLEVFVEVANSGGFNRAAARLHVAQSALSRRVMQLEHDLGVSLLSRDRRGVQLTPAGELLFERARTLLRQLKQVRDDVTAEAGVARGEIALGLPPSLGKVLSGPLLAAMRERHPDLFVRSWVATSILLRDMLVTGKVDLAIFGVLEPERILHSTPLFRDPMFLVSPRASTPPRSPTWPHLASMPMILTSEPNSVRRLVDNAAGRRRHKLNVVMEVNDVPVLIDLVRDGVGHTLLPLSAIRESVRDGTVLTTRIPNLDYLWVIAWSKERSLTAAMMHTTKEVKRIGAKIASSGASL